MNFGLSTKYAEFDFEAVNLADLMLVGGGCGESGGGSTTLQSVQTAAYVAQGQASPNGGASCTVITSEPGGNIGIYFNYVAHGTFNDCIAAVNSTSGNVTISSSSSGGFWASVSGFFSWLFGSH